MSLQVELVVLLVSAGLTDASEVSSGQLAPLTLSGFSTCVGNGRLAVLE